MLLHLGSRDDRLLLGYIGRQYLGDMEMDNLALWDSVSKTDLAYTKTVNQRGGYTAISPAYQAKMATEQFGPYGKGWGLSSSEFDASMFETTRMVIHKAIFFYILDGERSEFPISNSIFPMPVSKGAEKPDVEWVKKLETNTVSKALSRLGFNSDVFMGLFDDREYIDMLATEQAIEKAEDKDAEIAKEQEELTRYITKQLDGIKEYSSAPVINGVVKVSTRYLERIKSIPALRDLAERGLKAIVREATAKKTAIEDKADV